MADEVKIGLEVTTGASQANLEKGITAPLKGADAAGKAAATSLTEGVRQIEEATTGAAEAEHKLVQATEQVAEAGKGAGEGIAAGFERVTEAASSAVAAEEQVAQAAETIATAGEQASATTAEALGAVTDAAGATTTAVETIGEAATVAGEEATTAFDEATTAMEEAAAAAQQIGPNISEGFAEVADQAQLVQDAVDRFYQRLADGLAPGRGALRQISAQYSLLGEQIAEAEGLTAEEAAAAQANYKQIGAAIQGVIARQREFNAELRSTQIATKEGGEQLALMGIAAEQLGKHFGEVGAEVGSAAGEVGLLAAVLTQLTRAFKGLDLNTLATSFAGVKANMTGTAIQAGLVAAVFAVAVAAGTKLSESNELNKQSVDDLAKAFKDLVTGGGKLGEFSGQAQSDIQAITAHIIESKWSLVDFVKILEIAAAASDGDWSRVAALSAGYAELGKEINASARAQASAHLGAKIAAETQEALKKSTHELSGEVKTSAGEFGKLDAETSKLTTTQKFYLESQKLGIAGQRLWQQVLDESAGSAKKLDEIVKQHAPAMEKLVEAYHKAKAAFDLQLDGIKKQIEEERKLIEAEDAESRKIQQLVTDIGTEEAARRKLHATIQGELDDDAKLDTAKNGTSESIQNLAKHIAELTAQFDAEQPSIDDKIAKLEALGKSTVGLEAETKKYIDTIGEEKKKLDDLIQKNKALQQEEDALTAKGQALTKADYDRIQAIDREISSNQIAVQQAKDRIAADAQLLSGQVAETKATTELFGAAGRASEAQDKLTASTKSAGTAAKGSSSDLGAYAKNVELSKEKAAQLSDASKGISISIDDAASSAGKAVPKIDEIGTGFGDIGKQAHLAKMDVNDVGTAIGATADKSKDAIDLFKKVAQEEQDEWKKSGIIVADHEKKIEDLTATYQKLRDTATTAIQDIITMLQKLDDQTKKTAGSGSTAAPPPTSAPSGPKPPASDSGGGSSGHS